MNPFSTIRDTVLAMASAVAGAAIAVVFTVVIYEGIPIGPLRHIPVLGPALETLTDGRVDRARKAARAGYVQEARLIAAEARNRELQRQLEAGRKASAGFAELLADARAQALADQADDEKKEQDYEAKLAASGRSCALDSDDIEWLRQ